MTRCKRCVLPESKPDITVDAEGICSVCREHDKQKQSGANADFLESDFVRMIDKYRGRGGYECLVMCSGGKDSTAALYYMVKRYRMKALAFTFDHGFETDDAMTNVRNAVEALGTDFLFFKTNEMRRMFARMVDTESRAVICHPCSIWYMRLTFDMCAKFDIPLIIAGWTKGQSAKSGVMTKCACNINAPEYASMGKATKEFLGTLKDDPEYRDFPATMEEVQDRAKKKHKAIVLSPHWFLGNMAEDYVEIIKRECGWKPPALSYPGNSTNCAMNNFSAFFSLKHYGFTHYHVEMSRLIREGLMTRQEAMRLLRLTFGREHLEELAAKLGCRFKWDESVAGKAV